MHLLFAATGQALKNPPDLALKAVFGDLFLGFNLLIVPFSPYTIKGIIFRVNLPINDTLNITLRQMFALVVVPP
jgi:hypothetical protein